MSIIEDLQEKWDDMDEVDRKNFYIAVGFLVLILILLHSLTNTMGVLGGFFSSGVEIVNQSVSNLPVPTN